MRPSLRAALLAIAASAATVSGQDRPIPPARAFPAAITTSLGIHSFATRYVATATRVEYSFGSSVAVSVKGDMPLSRRLGLIAEASIAPLAKQRSDHPEFGRVVRDKIIVFGVDAGIAGRLKPGAPVFLQVGGGAIMATKHAIGGAEGRPFEPHAGFTVGYDASPFGRSNIRVTYSGRVVFADVPNTSSEAFGVGSTSAAYDQIVQVGIRFVPSRPAVRRAGR